MSEFERRENQDRTRIYAHFQVLTLKESSLEKK